MGKLLRGFLIVVINLALLVALFAGAEIYCRCKYPAGPGQFVATNGLWQKYMPYVMFATAPGTDAVWANELTGQNYPAHVVTNTLGFNDPHEFDYTKPYRKAANERVVLFTGGSVAWGVGATSTDKTIAGRMQ